MRSFTKIKGLPKDTSAKDFVEAIAPADTISTPVEIVSASQSKLLNEPIQVLNMMSASETFDEQISNMPERLQTLADYFGARAVSTSGYAMPDGQLTTRVSLYEYGPEFFPSQAPR